MPEIIVWPDSSSVFTLNDGSSFANFWRPMPIFDSSSVDFGSTATDITGAGNSIFSRVITLFKSDNVSPVVTFFKPTAAAISPALTSFISSLVFECICKILPILSFWDLRGL